MSLATSSSGVTRALCTAVIGSMVSGTRFVPHSHSRSSEYSRKASAEIRAALRTEDATGRPANTTKYIRKIGDLSANTPDCATAYPPMIAVTAVTSTIGFTAESQLGSSGRLYQIQYWATVHNKVGSSTDTLAMLSGWDRCGAYIKAAAVSRKTTAARNPLRIRSARSRLRRRLCGGANAEVANSCIK